MVKAALLFNLWILDMRIARVYLHLIRHPFHALRQLDPSHRIANVNTSTSLAAFTIDGERVGNRGFGDKPVQGCPEHSIVVEAVEERWIACGLLR